jgi:GT2 family glycosyltransferase
MSHPIANKNKEIVMDFQSGQWLPADRIKRSFVKYANPNDSPAALWQYAPENLAVTVSVVIPTFDACRNGYFLKLLDQLNRQSIKHFEIIVVRGDPRQGRAINIGAAIARGTYIMTLDDDTSLSDPNTFQKLVAVMEAHPDIGIAGGNNVIPQDANPFLRRVMKEIPRRSWEPVQSISESDLAEHPCMIMRTCEFKRIGGENELIPRGLDPYLREEFRKLGKRVVVVPGVVYHHLPPANLNKLLRQFFRNGRQAAYTNRNYPQWVIETASAHGPFKAHVALPLRILRFPIRLLKAFIIGKYVWFLCELAYALGFAGEFLLRGSNDG